jgi:hypothetical protein
MSVEVSRGRWALVVILATAAGCWRATPYGSSSILWGGYEDSQVGAGTFQVTFYGNRFADRLRVETYLQYRCAEVVLAAGYDYFVVLRAATEVLTPYGRSSVGAAIDGIAQDAVPQRYVHGPDPEYIALAEVQGFRGSKPANNPAAFDAREVIRNLGPWVAK